MYTKITLSTFEIMIWFMTVNGPLGKKQLFFPSVNTQINMFRLRDQCSMAQKVSFLIYLCNT